MKNFIKPMLKGTRWERMARGCQQFLRTGHFHPLLGEGDLRDARDNAYARIAMREALKNGLVGVDVGAHRGFFLRQFLEFSPSATHWAFEPIPILAQELRKNFPGVRVIECALSDKEGTADFQYVKDLPGWSGLQPQVYPRQVHKETIRVELKRLDTLLPTNTPVGFIKIDVEGAELQVLRGARELLVQARPVIFFECAKAHHHYYNTTPELVHEFFESIGYRIYLLDRSGPLSREEFAAVYISSYKAGYDRHSWGNYLALSV